MRWRKDRVLGAGAFGMVCMAVPGHFSSSWFSSPSCVAVKSANLELSDSLQEEAEFLYSLRGCPNIVHCYGDDASMEDGRQVYNLLLEYAPGGKLEILIKSSQEKMSEAEVAYYAYQLLKGVSYMHGLGIVHCDLKPRNILVYPMQDGANRLKIADFGLALCAADNSALEFCKEYDCHDTLLYTSPESLEYGIDEAPRDIWALGCIIVEMIAKKPVWEYCNTKDLTVKIKFEKPRIPDNISTLCKDFLKWCFERNHHERWAAKRLMTHPFILKNFDSVLYWTKEDHEYELPENPFGHDDQWISSKDLFSTVTQYSYYRCMNDD